MENLEELKKEAARFKARGSRVPTLSEYKIVSALRIKSLVAKRLYIENNLPNTILSLKFLVNIIGKKKDFSIEGIRLDLTNGDSVEEVAMKYCEPIEVILEIKDRDLRSEEEIVASKIYTTLELTKVFNKSKTETILQNSFLSKIGEKSLSELVNWWTGEKILNNYTKIVNLFNNEGIVVEGKEYIPITRASSILDIPVKATEHRLRKGHKMFGIKISIITLKKQSVIRNNKMYVLLSDVLEAKKNKKYYIQHKDVFNRNALTYHAYLTLKRLYKSRFSKEISFIDCYIKKENLNNFIEVSKVFGYYKDEMLVR